MTPVDFLRDFESAETIGVIALVLVVLYYILKPFEDDIRFLLRSIPERKKRLDLIIENNTAALELCKSAVESNTEVLRSIQEERNALLSSIKEHDRISEQRLNTIEKSIERCEQKL